MKNKILAFALTGVIAMISMTVSAQENKRAAQARKDLREAKIDSATDFHRFKKEAEIKIRDNENKIADLKAKKLSGTKEVREEYDQKVLAIEKKNNELKEKIKGANTTKTSMWTSFKRAFNRDMDSIETSIKNI